MKKTKLKSQGVNSWPECDRPREKLMRQGSFALTDTELLAIILRVGVKGLSAVDLSRDIMNEFKTFRGICGADSSRWKKFKGLGLAKIAQIRAALEIGRRYCEETARQDLVEIKSAKDAVSFLMPRMRDLKKEVFKLILLDSKSKILALEEVTQGTVDRAHPIPREIFSRVLRRHAASFICAHNHPSGDCAPSVQDKQFTEKLGEAAQALQIGFLDHIIIGDNSFYSFRDQGVLSK